MTWISSWRALLGVATAFTALVGCASTAPRSLPGWTEQTQLFEYAEGRFVTVMTDQGDCSVAFQGRISSDFESTFLRTMAAVESRACRSRLITLDSGGGLVLPALRAGERLRQWGYTTEVAGWESGRCASACGLLFIAGVERVAKPEAATDHKAAGLGVHQSSKKVGDRKICLPEDTALPSSNARVKAYVERMLPPVGAQMYLQLRAQTDCRRMRYLSLDELLQGGIATRKAGA